MMLLFGFEQLAFDSRVLVDNHGRISMRFETMGPTSIGHAGIPGYMIVAAFVARYRLVLAAMYHCSGVNVPAIAL